MLSPCCPRPHLHAYLPCTLQARLKNPKLEFDELLPEEQYFLFVAPYLPSFSSFPTMAEWCDPSVNAQGYTFARLHRDPRRSKSSFPQWRQDGSLYVAASGFATGYFSDKTDARNKRWRVMEFLAPGSFEETTRPHRGGEGAVRELTNKSTECEDAVVEIDQALSSASSPPKRARRASSDGQPVPRKKKRTSRRKRKEAYYTVLQLRSEHASCLPLVHSTAVCQVDASEQETPETLFA